MIERKEYADQLRQWKNQPIIKVITGVRRCGKSTLLRLFQEELIAGGIKTEQCIAINFEDIAFEPLTDYHLLYDYLLERLVPGKMTYIFLDEIQQVNEFQKVVNSLQLKANVDLYLTGSNAYMLSGELATLLSGRYIEISMLPLSFREYYEIVGGEKQQAFTAYYRNGGFPFTATLTVQETLREYLQGVYSTVLLKDIAARKRISDIPLLESVIRFLADNIGNIVSGKKIADSLNSAGRKTTASTVDTYVQALKDAYILYEADRFDIKGKQHLASLEKYYFVDPGLRTFLLGERTCDIGRVLENIVYLELLRRGYRVSIGKVNTMEVDFVAEKGEDRIYYQVAASIMDETTYEREFKALKSILDHYPKYVLTMDTLPMGEDGIKQINIVDFLLGE